LRRRHALPAVDSKPKRSRTLRRIENARPPERDDPGRPLEDWRRLWWIRVRGARVLDEGGGLRMRWRC
jgi:hypothetical protein